MNLYKQVQKLGSLFKQQNQLFKTNSYFAFSSTQESKELQQLANMLGLKYQKVNEDIPNNGDIRLVNDQSKQIGVFTYEQAMSQARSKGMDLILVSESVKPMICKVTNYKEFLYDKFIREVVQQDSSFKSQKGGKKSEKKIQISTNISMGDLKNKAAQTCDFAQKFEKFTVFLYCNEKNLEEAKNILYTFSDMVGTELSNEDNELKEAEVDVKYLEREEVEQEDSSISKRVQMTFISNSYVADTKQFSQEEIKKLVSQYFNQSKVRQSKKEEFDSKDLKGDEQENQLYKEQYEEEDLDSLIMQQKKLVDETEDFSEELALSMAQYAKSNSMSMEQLQAQVEELKVKYDSNAQDALLRDLFQQQHKKLKNISRIARILGN